MKTISSLLLTLLLASSLLGCVPQAEQATPAPSNSTPVSTPSNVPSPVNNTRSELASNLGLFTMDELFKQGGGGCGMTLWKQEDGLRPPGYLFYNRLAQRSGDEFTMMKLNGTFVRFRRTTATGKEFYGQQTSQTFLSRDGSTQLQVDVSPGQPGEIESMGVEGTLQIQQNGQTVKIPVQGSAGC